MNYIVTTIIMQLHLVVMYRLLFLEVALLTQTIGTTSHTHRFDISEKSIYWKTCFNYFSRLCLKKWNWRGYTESDEGTQNLTSAQPFWHSLSLQYQLWHYVKVKGISSLVSFLKLHIAPRCQESDEDQFILRPRRFPKAAHRTKVSGANLEILNCLWDPCFLMYRMFWVTVTPS